MEKELNEAIDTSSYKIKWIQDPNGYFTIKPFPEKGKVFIRYYDFANKLKYTFSGNVAMEIGGKILEMGLISRLEHALYLGKELQKAIIALKENREYIQDDEM